MSAMHCANCGRANRAGARFCGGCGTALVARCPACGAAGERDAQFCDACGAALGDRAAETPVARKVVTVVFADLIGSVALHERLDAESARRVMDRYHRAMTAAIEVHGGRVVQLLGDGVLAAFGVPRVAEDDAIRAVRAGAGLQRAFRELLREQGGGMAGVGLRVAVNTGEIVVGDDENSVMGDPTNVAARLQQEARDGDVILGEATRHLVDDLVTLAPLGTFSLRGRIETVAAWRLVSLERPVRREATAFVGRDEELRRLESVYEAACAEPGPKLAVVLGSPGLGKSRLVGEFAQRVGAHAAVLSARCDTARGATFAPLTHALRAFLHLDDGADGDLLRATIDSVVSGADAERARVASGIAALLAGTPAAPEETFFVVRRLLAALAVVRPVLLVIDDLHWAEPLLLDLVEHLVQWSAGTRLLVLVAARPELRDVRSSLAAPGALVAEAVTLGGLDAGAAMRLAAGVIGAAELPAALVGRVLATSEGNPLFVAELVRMLAQDGTLHRDGERWVTTVEVAKLEMPPTIQVLLAARIERLRPEERRVLERAAVVGRHFSRAAVAHLLPPDTSDLDARLEALRRSELIETDTGWFLGEPGLRFHHVLIRDAAYRRVLKERRAELHERLADWIAERSAAAGEHDESIGWHLEQAFQNLCDLGPADARCRAIGKRAARHLGESGQRALARDDLALAAGLLGRAIACLDEDDEGRPDLALDWCEALLASGDVGPAAEALAVLERLATGSPRLAAWHACFAGQLASLTDPRALRAAAGAAATAAQRLAEVGDAAGQAKAHAVCAAALGRLGEIGDCETALDQALAAARRARDRRRANAVLAGAPLAALWGPSPVARASGRCLDVVRVLRITQGAPAVESVALRCQAVLEALRGRGEAARRMLAASRRMVEELGIAQEILEADVFAGLVELIEGDAEAAEGRLRTAYEGLRARGLGIDAARAAAGLGRALLVQGRIAEAEEASHASEALAGDDLKAAIAWRGVRAEALALRGDAAAAVEFATAAVALAAATDALLDHADARLSLAVALRAAGRQAEADAERREALALWEAKGATVLVERTLGAAGEPSSAPGTRTAAESGPARRIRGNGATRHEVRFDAALRARDRNALADLFADDLVVVHHPHGQSAGRDEHLRGLAMLLADSLRLETRRAALATLGDGLGLHRRQWRVEGVDGPGLSAGPAELDYVVIEDVDAAGRARRIEIFGADQLGRAVARLYALHAERQPEGAARAAALRTADAVARMQGPLDVDRAPFYAPDFVFVDHRRLGFGARHGSAEMRALLRSLEDGASDAALAYDDVLALEPGALLVRLTWGGTLRLGGGRFERQSLCIWAFRDGLVVRNELFDAESHEAALARFAALLDPSAGAPVHGRANRATEHAHRLEAAVAARDASALESLLGDGLELVDHPEGTRHDRADTARLLLALGPIEGPGGALEPVATLGEHLSLLRIRARSEASAAGPLSGGPLEPSSWLVLEVDAVGRSTGFERFAADRLGEAVHALYRRFAGLLPAGAQRATAEAVAESIAVLIGPHEAEAWALAMAQGLVAQDWRTVGYGTVRGRDAATGLLRSTAALARTTHVRVDAVLRLDPRGFALRWTDFGVLPEGGSFERGLCVVGLFDAEGKLARWEQFDAEDGPRALARFDGLLGGSLSPAARASLAEEVSGAGDVREPPTGTAALARRVRRNAATEDAARLSAALAARDEPALADLFADFVEVVHHPTGITYGAEGALTSFRRTLRSAASFAFGHEPLATLGEQLALVRHLATYSGFAFEDLDAGASERDLVVLVEATSTGRRHRSEIFSGDALHDATARLYERYAERMPDGPPRLRAAATARTVASLFGSALDAEGCFAPDCAFVDHRPIGFASFRGTERLGHSFRVLGELIEDTKSRVTDVLDLRPEGFVLRVVMSMIQRDTGGLVEYERLDLRRFDADGRIDVTEWFETDAVDRALARLDVLLPAPPATGLVADPAGLPIRFPTNAAVRAMQRFREAAAADDREALESLFAPNCSFEDRRRGLGDTGDRGKRLASLRVSSASRTPATLEPLSTAGDRLALLRVRFTSSDGDALLSEIDTLQLAEVDADGRLLSIVVFDVEDRRAAAIEAMERFYTRTEGREMPGCGLAFVRAMRDRDIAAMRAALPDDFVFHDHRHSGLDRIGTADDFVAWMAAGVAESGDAVIEILGHLAIAEHGVLTRGRLFGTLRDGGDFEAPVLRIQRHESGRWVGVEVFEPEDVERARARFAELGREHAARERDPLRILPNAAARAMARLRTLEAAGDWEALHGLLADDFAWEDRRRTGGGGRNALVEAMRRRASTARRIGGSLVATAGDRLALEQVVLAGSDDVERREAGRIELIELDASGRIARLVYSDAGQRRAALEELSARFAAGEAAGAAVHRTIVAFGRAVRAGAWDEARRLVAADARVRDHTLPGFGEGGRDALLRWSCSEAQQAPDAFAALVRIAAWSEEGRVDVCVTRGTMPDGGGPFESFFVRVILGDGERIDAFEIFPAEAFEAALARYEALRRDPLRIPPNAAVRAQVQLRELALDESWAELRALCAPMSFEDRRPLLRSKGDCATWIANARHIGRDVWRRATRTRIATAGERLALHCNHWRGGPDLEFEVDSLEVAEVDAAGRIVASICFEPADRAAAFAELRDRFAAGEAGGCAAQTVVAAFDRAVAARDWDGLRACLADEFVADGGGLYGIGHAGAAAFVDGLRARIATEPAYAIETLRIVHWNESGRVDVGCVVGTRDRAASPGLAFVRCVEVSGGRVARLVLFEPVEVDAALATLGAPRPAP